MAILSDLLEEQYSAIESFANAQSLLLNAISIQNSSKSSEPIDIAQSVERLNACRKHVRSSLDELEQVEDVRLHYKDHLDLSRRVIRTIAGNPSWSANGLPSHSSGILEANTVALASLRASISAVLENEVYR